MTILVDDGGRSAVPLTAAATSAREAGRILAAKADPRRPLRLRIVRKGRDGELVSLPPAAVRLLIDGLTQMARGNLVRLVPVRAELTTQQAADVLNVSRPFLVRLLDEGRIPARKVGTHRRVRVEDVIAYKRRIDAKRRKSLDALARQAQEMKMGY